MPTNIFKGLQRKLNRLAKGIEDRLPKFTSSDDESYEESQSTLSIHTDPRTRHDRPPVEDFRNPTNPQTLADAVESITNLGSIAEGKGSIMIQRMPPSLATPATALPRTEPVLVLERAAERISGQISRGDFQAALTTLSAEKEQLNLALLEAAAANQPELCCELLDVNQLEDLAADPNVKDSSGLTSMHFASRAGFVQVCEALLDHGERTKIDSTDPELKTPLHYACLHGQLPVTQLLVRSGANINFQDEQRNTPLHYAAELGHLEVVEYLLCRGPRFDLKNRAGKTAADMSASLEVAEVFRTYCRRKQIPNPMIGLAPFHQVKIYESLQEQVEMMMEGSFVGAQEEAKDMSRVGPNDFELLQMLGKGSFGEVYLVRKRDTDLHYAMKVLRKDKIIGQNLTKYAMTERNVLSYIRHPFIVGLNFAFQTRDKLFLILDYASGGDLGSYLAKERRFNEYRAKTYMCEVILALEELHRRDIIFRDLKPDNIVLDEEGHAKLTDFGLSKEGVLDNTMASSFCGSVAYLAPEVLKRQGHGKAVDWYLLGVLFYEMLVGSPPYFSHNRDQLFQNIQRGKLRIPSNLSIEAKSLLRGVSHSQLLQRDPAKRLGSGKNDAEEIKRHEFFGGINWGSVLNRELRPPLPHKPVILAAKLLPEKVYGVMHSRKDSETHLSGWSFVNKPED
jgi:protein-serine/threonine kinase